MYGRHFTRRFTIQRPFQVCCGLCLTIVAAFSEFAYAQSPIAELEASLSPVHPSATGTACSGPTMPAAFQSYVDFDALFPRPVRNEEPAGEGLPPIDFPSSAPIPSDVGRSFDDEVLFVIFDLDPRLFQPSDSPLVRVFQEEQRVKKAKEQVVAAARSFQRFEFTGGLKQLRELDLKGAPPPTLLLARMLTRASGGHRRDADTLRDAARKVLDQAALDDPTAPEPPLDAARAAVDDRRVGDALARLDRAAELLEKRAEDFYSPAHRVKLVKQLHALYARAYGMAERWPDVETACTHWIVLDAGDPEPLRLRAEAFYRMDSTSLEKHRLAEDDFKAAYLSAASRLKEGIVEAYPPPEMAMARLAATAKHQETAATWVERLRRALPDYVRENPAERLRCGLFLARRSFDAGEFAAARRDYAEAVKNSAPLFETRRFSAVLAWFEAVPTAAGELSSLFLERPDDEQVAGTLARALAESNTGLDRDRAVRVARINLAAHSDSRSAHLTLGWAYLHANQPDHAQAAIRPILRELIEPSLQMRQRGRPSPAPFDSDDAYILARTLFGSPQIPTRINIVIDLLQRSVQPVGPSRYRLKARQWLDQLSDVRSGPPPAPAPPAKN
jgi:tetratricopeptide (TPR) repeat protein